MISQELAEKLKDAGLLWEPKEGDEYSHLGNSPEVFVKALIGYKSKIATEHLKIYDEEFPNGRLTTLKEMLLEKSTWLPRLDQLLAEIEKRGWKWDLYPLKNKYCCLATQTTAFPIYEEEDSPEEAAGQALLWMLMRGDLR